MQYVPLARLNAISALATILAAAPVAAEVFNIRVSYYDTFANAESRKAGIEANFKHMAEGLYESTNGAHTLGKVTVYTDAAYNDNATVVWVASCWPNAHINGFGSAGQRIEHCDTFPNGGSPINFVERARSGGFTLMHEWGHFTYAIYDEYQNDSEACGDPGSPCKDDVGISNAVMNSHWGAVGESESIGDLNWLNFSTANSNTASTNAQFRIYQASSWDVLARPDSQDPTPGKRKQYEDLANVKPAEGQTPSLEINTEEGLSKAVANLTFEWVAGTNANASRAGARAAGVDNQATTAKLIVIDNSAATSAAMLDEVKIAVQTLIDNAEEGEQIVVVALDSANPLAVPLTTIGDEASRDSLIGMIDGISAGTTPVLPAALLNAVANALVNFAPQLDSTTPSLYLFANGLTGKDLITPEIARGLADAADMMLYIFDLGTDDAAGSVLRNLAEQSEGLYLPADTPEKLDTALEQADLEGSPAVDAILADGSESVSGEKEFPFVVDASLGEVDISVEYTGTATFKLIDPQGNAIPFTTEECADVPNACFSQLNQPTVGTWKLVANGTATVEYNIAGFPTDNGSAIFSNVSTLKQADGSLLIEAKTSSDEQTITGINVAANVTAPNGTTVQVNLNDNGVAPDSKAKDGVYSGSLANAEDGDYTVVVNFDNAAGSGQVTNASAAFAPSTTGTLPSVTMQPLATNFTRIAQTQATILSPYKRVMNWGEAMYADLLPMRGKQELDIPVEGVVYKVRHYPTTDTYLGYNPQDGNLYLYGTRTTSGQLLNLGPLTPFANKATAAGF